MVSAGAIFEVTHNCRLVVEDACYSLGVESAVPIFTLALQCNLALQLLDVPSNVAILSRSPPDEKNGNLTLATYRCGTAVSCCRLRPSVQCRPAVQPIAAAAGRAQQLPSRRARRPTRSVNMTLTKHGCAGSLVVVAMHRHAGLVLLSNNANTHACYMLRAAHRTLASQTSCWATLQSRLAAALLLPSSRCIRRHSCSRSTQL
jgi:hypothetical protein